MVQFNSSLGDKGFHTFPKGISPKVNVIVQLEFELTHYNVLVQHISHGNAPLLSMGHIDLCENY